MKMEEFKEILTFDIEESAHWRACKAEEFPEDDRNSRCSGALAKLSESMERIDHNHPLLIRLRRFEETAFEQDRHLELIERRSSLIGRYGFDNPNDDGTNTEGFLQELISEYEKEFGGMPPDLKIVSP